MNAENYKGRVVETGTHEYRMSDYSEFGRYAIILLNDGTYFRVQGYDLKVEVDASPEQVQAYKDHVAAAKAAAMAKIAADRAELEAKTPRIGKRVRVVKGRKVAIGTEGILFWMKEMTFTPRFRNGYKKGPDTVKIGIALDDAKDARGRFVNVAWSYIQNIEVVAA